MRLRLFLIGFIAAVCSKPHSDTVGVVYTIEIVPNDVVTNSLELAPTNNLKKNLQQSAIEELLKHILFCNEREDDDKAESPKEEENYFDFAKIFGESVMDELPKHEFQTLTPKYEENDFKHLKNLQQSAIDDVLKHVLLSKINDKEGGMIVSKNEDKDFGHIKVLQQSAINNVLKHVLLGDINDDNDERIQDSKDEGKGFDLLKKSKFMSRLKRRAENFQNDPPTIVDILGYTPLRDFNGNLNNQDQGLSMLDDIYPQIQPTTFQKPFVRKPQVPNLPIFYNRAIRQNNAGNQKPQVTNLPLLDAPGLGQFSLFNV
ncbi:uncharacterized protein [Onthophagus taurus]|uniref:uncharacterized protein n=1 Tax=Onthophagus taurus TaxID=166361 RepID=UPI0039BE0718